MNTPQQPGSQPSASNGRKPEEIEREIESTREQVNQTLGELESKLSPRERLREAAASAREFGTRLGRSASTSLGATTMIRLDHTHALALFRRFRPHTSAGRKKALAANVCLALEIHAQLEEEIFYPAMRELDGEDSILAKSVAEHDEMRELIETVRNFPVTDASYDDTVWKLMRVVLHHVADEESTLLPLAERVIPERLGELGRQMTRRRLELLRPHWGEVARTSAQSFPLATATAAAGLLAIAWFIGRPRPSRRFGGDWLRDGTDWLRR
jgi:hemerythrin superfamily protein